MPTVSGFFGITIRMFHKDHPPPHFHAEYQGQRATFDFEGRLLEGQIKSAIARRLIREWARLRQAELTENWENIEHDQTINRIAPLD